MNAILRIINNQHGAFMLPALPFISAGFSFLQGIAGFASGRHNAAYAEAEANSALLAGRAEKDRQRRVNAYKESEFRAELGGSGTVGDVSPMLAYLENVKHGELMAQDKMYQGRLTAFGRNQEARNYRAKGMWDLIGGGAAGLSTLGSTLLK